MLSLKSVCVWPRGSFAPGNAIKVGRRQLVPDMGPDGPRLLAFLSEMSGFWQAFLFSPGHRLQCSLQQRVANMIEGLRVLSPTPAFRAWLPSVFLSVK